jgi:DNA-binding LacI/PurR family transcriptional regulator
MMQQDERPDGFFCFNDRIAKGTYVAASERF